MDKQEITILRLMGQDKFVAGRKLTLSADEYKNNWSNERV